MLPGKAQACAAVSAQVLRLAHFHLILLLQVEERCVNNVALSCLRRLTSGMSVALVICTDCSCMFMRFLLLVAVPAAVMNREQHGTAVGKGARRSIAAFDGVLFRQLRHFAKDLFRNGGDGIQQPADSCRGCPKLN